jgi:hypothetical protein
MTQHSFAVEFTWHPWKFSRLPNDHWDTLENQIKYFDYLAEELNIQLQEDWYKVNQ